MVIMGDRVPMFKLRPYRSVLVFAILTGIVGGLLSAHFFAEDAYLAENRGVITLIFTTVIVILLLIIAYSRFGFGHLRHHHPGYKRG